jgi:nitroreductase
MTAPFDPLAGFGKPAPADFEIHDLIRERWSPRAFSAEPVPESAIDSLLEAARWAPSSSNEQPWHFILASRNGDPEGHSRIVSVLVPFNQAWASKAPLLAISVARLDSTSGEPNKWALYDTGQAVAQLAIQATAMGISVHQMAGFDPTLARERLGIPDGYEPVTAIAIGYRGDPQELSPKLQAREAAPRVRRPAREWAFEGRWGRPRGDAPEP